MNRKIIFLIFSGILFSTTLNAQIVTDRPDQTESSSTVGKGQLQLESGFLLGFEGDEGNSLRQILFPTNLFRYGLFQKIELRLVNQYEVLKIGEETTQGISDLEVGFKIQLLKDDNRNTEMAFLTHVLFPTGTMELTNDDFGTINKLSISHALSENIGLGYNVGYNYFGEDKGDLTYSLALGVGVNDKVGLYVEPYGQITNMEDFVLNFDAGMTYLANENLQFDLSFGTGLNVRMNYLSIGCSWLILKHDSKQETID